MEPIILNELMITYPDPDGYAEYVSRRTGVAYKTNNMKVAAILEMFIGIKINGLDMETFSTYRERYKEAQNWVNSIEPEALVWLNKNY